MICMIFQYGTWCFTNWKKQTSKSPTQLSSNLLVVVLVKDPRKSPKGCAPIPDKILRFWPEVPIYPDKNCKILDKVCAKVWIKFCRDGTLCRPG